MGGIILFILLAALFIFGMPILALVRAANAARQARELAERVGALEHKLDWQRKELARVTAGLPMETAPAMEVTPPRWPRRPEAMKPAVAFQEEALPEVALGALDKSVVTPPATAPPAIPAPAIPAPVRSVSLEQFMGVKLFAWLGGVALFFGVIFFVRYAFEQDLIPPAVRVALGFVTGAGLLVGGLFAHRRAGYRVPAQALCATSVLILYGVTFAAHAIYGFAAFGPVSTMILMSLITATAFLVAVRLDALVVAVLGLLGGFITPFLLPMVQDDPFALFGYIAMLDIGLLAVISRGRWSFLSGGAVAGTALTLVAWHGQFFVAGGYDVGARTLVPMGILCFFSALFIASAWWNTRQQRDSIHPSAAAFTMLGVAMVVAFVFLSHERIAERTFLLYGYVLLLNVGAIFLGLLRPRLAECQVAMAAATLLHLAIWTGIWLKPEMLGSALAVYLVIGGLLAAWPVAAARLRFGSLLPVQQQVGLWIPPLVLLLLIMPVVVLPQASLLVWVAVLLVNLLVVGMAMMSLAILPVLAALLATLLLAAFWLFNVPAEIGSLGAFLVVVAFFSTGFVVAGAWLARRGLGGAGNEGAHIRQLQVMAGTAPFLLLILAVLQLPVANPSPVFGVALLLVALLMGLAVIGRQTLLFGVALGGTLAVEAAWHFPSFDPERPWLALAWYLAFHAVFTAVPFVFRRISASNTLPWAVCALSGIGHFVLVHDLVRQAFPNSMMGLIPAAFAIPAIAALVLVVRRWRGMDDPALHGRLAWLGGVALFFITMIFPIQFDRQWLTVGWALEGAALVWLFRRVRHPGLLWTGLALLGIVFLRLTLNPAVFTDYMRSGTRIFNWHLYVYGIAAASHFLAARWLPGESSGVCGADARPVLWSLGGLLLFLLVNIQIADFFTAPGDRFVAFQFVGNFARDMTYTIAWGLFALGLLVIGISLRARGARFAAIGLLGLTLLKLFVHDLANIESIYRIGALIAVAVIAFIASFLYQRFFNQIERA